MSRRRRRGGTEPVFVMIRTVLGENVMQIPVLIEPVGTMNFRARSGEPLSLSAEGATRDEALQKLHQLLQTRLAEGAEVVSLEVGEHPLARFAGMFKNDPMFEEWQQAIEEYRRNADEAEEQPAE